jgi:serine/threonine protein kinase
MARRYFK